MNIDDSIDKAHQQDQSLEEGANKRFLNSHHVQYEEGDSNDQPSINQDQSNDESMDRYLAAMEDNHGDQPQFPIENSTNSRGNRGNRGNRNQQVQQKNQEKQQQVEQQEEKSEQRRGRGRRNRMPNNLSDDQKQPESSYPKVQISKSQTNQGKPQEKEQKQEKLEQDQKPQKEKEKQNSDSESEGWDNSMDNKGTQNQRKPQARNGRSGRGQPQVQAKQEENDKVLDESNWELEADNQKQKEESKPPKRGGRKNEDDDQEELKPDNDKSDWNQNQTSKQPVQQNPRRGRGNRGNRQNRDQNGQNDNQNEGRGRRGNRDFNSDNNGYQNRPQYSRGENNYGRNRDNNNGRERDGGNWRGGNRGGYRGGFRGNQDRDNNNEHQQRNGRNFDRRNQNNDRYDNRQQESKSQNNQSSQVSNKGQVPVYDAVPIIEPKGSESWPQVSFYVRKCKVSVTLRNINENKADAVVFPFEDLKFKLYPSTLICEDSKFNYRKKIQEKCDQGYFKDRNCYPKKGKPIGNFNDILFWKVSTKDEVEIKRFIQQLFMFLDMEKKSKSVVFPICKELGGFQVLLASAIDCLHLLSKHNQGFIEKFQFTTKDPEYFKEAGKVFWETIMNHIDSNQIYIL